jgi:hypothetical protein
VKSNEFTRRNGLFTLSLWSPADIGLPFGSIPRLLLVYCSTQAVKTKSPEIVLGRTLTSFMADLGFLPTGGRAGSIPRFRLQAERLFSCTVRYSEKSPNVFLRGGGFMIAKEQRLWWNRPDHAALWRSTVTLSHEFFEEILDAPVPLDLRALFLLRRSPLALDIYQWLTWRMSCLRKKTVMPWESVAMQFGADYGVPRQFKFAFLKQLAKVLVVYPKANVEPGDGGLILKPSPTHVPAQNALT